MMLTPEQRAQKALAESLVGKPLRWAHEVPYLTNAPPLAIETVTETGMVTLKGWTGEFAPHLFTVVEDPAG